MRHLQTPLPPTKSRKREGPRHRSPGIGVATDAYSHARAVKRRETTSTSANQARVRRDYRPMWLLPRARKGLEVLEDTLLCAPTSRGPNARRRPELHHMALALAGHEVWFNAFEKRGMSAALASNHGASKNPRSARFPACEVVS